MIRPAVIMTAIFSTIATLQVFNEPYAIHQISYGGVSTTWTPLMTVYRDTYTANNIYLGCRRVHRHRGDDVRALGRRAADHQPPDLRRRGQMSPAVF